MSKDFFKWSKKYSVGVRILDYDHQELFSLVNDLHGFIERNEGQKHLVPLVNSLFRYVNEHFEREEHIMSEYKCPNLAEHQQHHQEFLSLIYAIRIVLISHPGRVSPQKLLNLLAEWLDKHVMGDDQKYAEYVTGKYGRRKVDFTRPLEIKKQKHDGVPTDEHEEMVSLIPRCAEYDSFRGFPNAKKSESMEEIDSEVCDG